MGIVVFDLARFRARYPEFGGIEDPTVEACWNEGGVFCNNTDASPVSDFSAGGMRSVLLNMMAAHILALNFGVNGQKPSQLVGRINSASQGSVSVGSDMGAVSGTAAWFMQTQYGATFWQASAPYRTFKYFAGASRPQSGAAYAR
jgi:hypothetical protein